MEGNARKMILIVDDEKEVVHLLSVRLLQEGYMVDVAFDALGALSKAVKIKPDCIVIDIMMPAGGGIKLLESIRNISDLFTTPVIVITATLDPKVKDRATALGISGYLLKPYEATEIIKTVKEALQDRATRL